MHHGGGVWPLRRLEDLLPDALLDLGEEEGRRRRLDVVLVRAGPRVALLAAAPRPGAGGLHPRVVGGGQVQGVVLMVAAGVVRVGDQGVVPRRAHEHGTGGRHHGHAPLVEAGAFLGDGGAHPSAPARRRKDRGGLGDEGGTRG